MSRQRTLLDFTKAGYDEQAQNDDSDASTDVSDINSDDDPKSHTPFSTNGPPTFKLLEPPLHKLCVRP